MFSSNTTALSVVEESPLFDRNTFSFPFRGTSTGRCSSHTSFSVRIIQLFFHTPLPPTFLHTFALRERESESTHKHTHTRGINRLFLSRAAASRLVLMMTTGICAGARAGMAAHGHPKTAQSHRNHQQPCCRSPPSFHPSLPPLSSGTTNTASQSWQHEMELRVCGYFKRSHQSHRFLFAFSQ